MEYEYTRKFEKYTIPYQLYGYSWGCACAKLQKWFKSADGQIKMHIRLFLIFKVLHIVQINGENFFEGYQQ